jgi:hypothetical protein
VASPSEAGSPFVGVVAPFEGLLERPGPPRDRGRPEAAVLEAGEARLDVLALDRPGVLRHAAIREERAELLYGLAVGLDRVRGLVLAASVALERLEVGGDRVAHARMLALGGRTIRDARTVMVSTQTGTPSDALGP